MKNIDFDEEIQQFFDSVANENVQFSSQEAGRTTLNTATTKKKETLGIKLQIDKAQLLDAINKGFKGMDKEGQR